MKIFVAQIKSLAGDIKGNLSRIKDIYNMASNNNCDICLLPELATSGYLAEDLFLRVDFIEALNNLNIELIKNTNACALIIPTLLEKNNQLYNSVIVGQHGKIIGTTYKAILPNHGIFDEKRYFTSGASKIVVINGMKIGIPICEDIWHFDVCNNLKKQGAEIFLVPNASPFELGKLNLRFRQVIERYNEHKIPLIFCNQATAQDGIIFDGNSFCFDGNLKQLCAAFAQDSVIVKYENNLFSPISIVSSISKSKEIGCQHFINSKIDIENLLDFSINNDCLQDDPSSINQALIFGLKSYVEDNGFKKVILGLSGGIDSAIVAYICAKSLGANNVTAYILPSRFNSKESRMDALKLAENLNINVIEIFIGEIMESFVKNLKLQENATAEDLTYQNLQARIRGTILMSQANKTDSLLITTGNKSEYATGYATIYGDMNGAFNPIKDLYKTQIFSQALYINSLKPVIPENIITKPPSAELSSNQKDSDSLPEYELLDKILYNYLEKKKPLKELYQDFNFQLVDKIVSLIKKSEFKRKQSAPGIKISTLNFEKDRRFPITNKFS